MAPYSPDDDSPPLSLAERVDDLLLLLDRYRSDRRFTAPLLLLVAALVGSAWWFSRTSATVPIEELVPQVTLEPAVADTQRDAPLIVHVVGAVRFPGVFSLPSSSRVLDAIEAAGGASADADVEQLNLAALLNDSSQVRVPRLGEVLAPSEPSANSGSGAGLNGTGAININTASAAQLEALPGVGPATASAIVAFRDDHGPFATVDALVGVPGIGPAKLAALADRAVTR